MDHYVDKNGKHVFTIDDNGNIIDSKLKKKKKEELEDETTESEVLPEDGED